MKFDKKYISKRITVVVVIAAIVVIAIIVRTVVTATVERDKWREVGKVSIGDTTELRQNRGNIYSADGQLMASSLPDYNIFIDFVSGVETYDTIDASGKKVKAYNQEQLAMKDSLWISNMDSICSGLARICDKHTKEEYKEHLMKGLNGRKRYWEIYPHTVFNFIQFNELKQLPIFCFKNRYKSGMSFVPRNNRNKPFGSLAKRTLGEMYAAKDSARSGLELAYDSYLRGVPGRKHRKKVHNKYLDIIDQEPVDGYDLVSTIDVSMQDICESALREKLVELEAEMGVVVLMEVKTGDVKAIVNLQRYDDGKYYEARNYALASLMEPGSTFKTASIMVGMDDGYIKPHDVVATGGGVCPMYGSLMKDHNWATRGGYGDIDVTQILKYSSNVGVSKLIDKYYHSQPEKFVEGLHRIGIGQPLGLPFSGAANPKIRMPNDTVHYWSKTTLPWMSIGYETQIPPISTVTFYNAIANGGKMVRPRFVKGIEKNGEMIEEFPVEVIKPMICKPQTLKDIQEILEKVVNDKDGTGKKAGNPYFHVSGKTGTAQVSYRKGSGAREHLVSFCGYYPSDAPKYSCIVAIRHSYYVASGGGQAGVVFSKIAQRVSSKIITTDLNRAKDSLSVYVPDVKKGDVVSAKYVLSQLGIASSSAEGVRWGSAFTGDEYVSFEKMNDTPEIVPNVIGMGARDAAYLMGVRGLKVRMKGCGKVKSQSIAYGAKAKKGQTVLLVLD
ncbi:MAG: transpeptidase family protein [Bacteroidaceae bacterium]|nr:transpeptidase family protein [Bacteroidaceae bacterium]